jgi:hypothetical protein
MSYCRGHSSDLKKHKLETTYMLHELTEKHISVLTFLIERMIIFGFLLLCNAVVIHLIAEIWNLLQNFKHYL